MFKAARNQRHGHYRHSLERSVSREPWGRSYLIQLVPDLVEVAEDLGMDLGTADVVDVAHDTQNPSPEHKGRVGVPTGQAAAGDDADVIRKALAAVCTAPAQEGHGETQEVRSNGLLRRLIMATHRILMP